MNAVKTFTFFFEDLRFLAANFCKICVFSCQKFILTAFTRILTNEKLTQTDFNGSPAARQQLLPLRRLSLKSIFFWMMTLNQIPYIMENIGLKFCKFRSF